MIACTVPVRWVPTAVVLILAGVVVAGCELIGLSTSATGSDRAVGYPAGCAAYGLSQKRCDAIVGEIRTRLNVGARAVAAIDLLPDPGCGQNQDQGGGQVLCARTTAFVARVRFRFVDGGTAEDSVFCGVGGQYSILCNDNPEIRISTPMDAYHDVPCGADPGAGCASPVPPADPTAVAAARPLRLATLDIPIDHKGSYRVEVGRSALPNGLLSDASFGLVDDHPAGVTISEEGIVLEVVATDGRPLWNAYEHGWRRGVEEVRAVLAFDVDAFEPGAVLRIRDVVVR